MSLDELVASAQALVERGATPACQVAVARDGRLLCFETFGAATNRTRFMVFSATKPIVASAVWVLIGDGLLDVDRPVAHYIPEFATNGKEVVTVEQVMLHTAGFPNAPMDPVEGGDTVTRVKRFTEWQLEWEPGTRFEYHALAAHWVLAELIERLSGDDFRDFLETRVCAPTGLAARARPRRRRTGRHRRRRTARRIGREPQSGERRHAEIQRSRGARRGRPRRWRRS